MSEHKDAMIAVLREVSCRLDKIDRTLDNLAMAMTSHAEDFQQHRLAVTATLSAHGARLQKMEQGVNGSY